MASNGCDCARLRRKVVVMVVVLHKSCKRFADEGTAIGSLGSDFRSDVIIFDHEFHHR